ncbi:MAG: hypothetical protein D6713_04100 [Deltaproteobacteria bacterium]|nr:MAG: hypothetical protein D6713_04100 [Deltaproteobacteria bacterium]
MFMKKGLLVALALVVLLLIGGAVYIAVTFNPEDYRPALEEALSRRVGRKVTMGRLALAFSRGVAVEVRDFSVTGAPPHPEETPLRFRRGLLRVGLFPLLTGRVVVREVVLESPSIIVRKYADGRLSVSDIIESFREKGGEGVPSGVEEERAPLAVSIDSVSIEEGSITFVSARQTGPPSIFTVSPVNIRAEGIRFDEPFRVEVSLRQTEPFLLPLEFSGEATVNPGEKGVERVTFSLSGKAGRIPLEVKGDVSPSAGTPEFQLLLTSNSVKPGAVADLVEKVTGKKFPLRAEGEGKFSLAAGGTAEEFGFEAEVRGKEVALFYGDIFEKYSGEEFGLVVQGRFMKSKVYISNGEILVPQVLSSVNAEYDLSEGRGSVTCAFDVKKLQSLIRYFPPLERMHLTGGLTASVTVRGGGAAWKLVKGAADVKDVNLDVEGYDLPLRALSGHLEVEGERIVMSPLSGLVAGQRVALKGHARWGEEIGGVFTLTSDYLDVDSLMGRLKTLEKKKGGKAAPSQAQKTPLVQRMNISLFARLGGARFRGMEVKDFSGTLVLRRGEFFWKDVSARAFGGAVQSTGSAKVGGEALPVSLVLNTEGLSLFEFLKSATSLGGVADGNLSLSFQGKGDVSSMARLAETLTGKGVIRIKKGRISNFDLLGDVLGLVQAVGGELPVKKTKFTEFEAVEAPFSVEGGTVRAKRVRIEGKGFSFTGEGTVKGLSRIELEGELKLPASFARKVKVPFVRKTKEGVFVPVRIGGPLNGLSVALNPRKVLRQKGKELIENIMKERLPGKLFR